MRVLSDRYEDVERQTLRAPKKAIQKFSQLALSLSSRSASRFEQRFKRRGSEVGDDQDQAALFSPLAGEEGRARAGTYNHAEVKIGEQMFASVRKSTGRR